MFGQRLRLARKRAGLSLRALAERMDPRVSAQAISKYEAGRMMPSSAVLVGLGEALDVSLDFLMSDRIDVLDGLDFRKDPDTSRRDRARAEAVLIDSLERYLTIEEILGIPPAGDRFEHCRCGYIATETEIDERADRLREAWDLGMDPVPSLCALLEEKGIKVVEADLP
ncbi:MAG: helix-turn-helix transcriptional regulator, partial [Gemmatimonadetes bacterium]|nr:helix-turn-helix transcriptional regulator [Gemmatimonadota bacterium]